MTRVAPIYLKCPCCNCDFTSTSFSSTNNFGGQTTDFNMCAAGTQVITLQIHTCPDCGFTGTDDEYEYEEPLDESVRKLIAEKITPLIKGAFPKVPLVFTEWWIDETNDEPPASTTDRYIIAPLRSIKKLISKKISRLFKGDEKIYPEHQYEFAAWIAKWYNDKSIDIANKYLKAAWCAKEYNHLKKETYYRRLAIEHFEEALNKNEIDKSEVAKITYLIGELYRRIGDKRNANIWFDRVTEAAEGDEGDEEKQWLIDLAKQQKENPKEFFER